MEDDLYHQGQCFKFKFIRTPSGRARARSFFASLSDAEVVDVITTFSILETSLTTGRSLAGRAKKVRGSKVGLVELKAGRLRMFVVVSGPTVWIADGFRKSTPEVQRYIARAEKVVSDWRARSKTKPRGEEAKPRNRQTTRGPR